MVGDVEEDRTEPDDADGLDAQGEEEPDPDQPDEGDAVVDQEGDGRESDAFPDALDMDEPEERPVQAWAMWCGGDYGELASSIVQTDDGGYLAVGNSYSFFERERALWLVKLHERGDVLWQAVFGGVYNGLVRKTSDGGYIVAANTSSHLPHVLLIKLDSDQNMEWQRGYYVDLWGIVSVGETEGGGYAIGGSGDDLPYAMMAVDARGEVTWRMELHGEGVHRDPFMFEPAPGNDFLAAGTMSDLINEGSNVWVCRLDSEGNVSWCRLYDNLEYDHARAMVQTPDGGAVFVGCTSVTFYGDMWAFKIGEAGDVLWEHAYPGDDIECAYAVGLTADGGFLVAGEIRPVNGNWTDVLVLRLDADGNLLWQRAYGTEHDDTIRSIAQAEDGGVIMAGGTDGDYWSERTGDFWVLKTDPIGFISDTCPEEIGSEAKLETSSSSIAVTAAHLFGATRQTSTRVSAFFIPLYTYLPSATQCRR